MTRTRLWCQDGAGAVPAATSLQGRPRLPDAADAAATRHGQLQPPGVTNRATLCCAAHQAHLPSSS